MTWQERAIELKQDHSWTETAHIIKKEYFNNDNEIDTYSRVRGYLRRYYARNHIKPQGNTEKIKENYDYSQKTELKADGTMISDRLIEIMDGENITPEMIVERHGLDSGKWQVIAYRNNLWNAQSKTGKVVMYQSRLTVKPIVSGLSLKDIDKHFDEMDRNYQPQPITITRRPGRECMAEVNIADLHFGKLAWHGDTGKDYDHKIAKRHFIQIVDNICAELLNKNLDYITFVWANDYFNSDTITNTTTAGTPQDTDCRWQKLFDVGVEMLVTAIDKLSQIARVKTFYLASNHDEMTSYYALKYLDAWYRGNHQVEINTDAQPRKYIMYGNTLIGFCHGCDIKPKQLSGLMPIEAREMWGKAKYCEMHTAHLHSEHMIEELNGIIVRRISSPTGTDTWHNRSGYIGQVMKAQVFVYDKEYGLEQVINTPVRE